MRRLKANLVWTLVEQFSSGIDISAVISSTLEFLIYKRFWGSATVSEIKYFGVFPGYKNG